MRTPDEFMEGRVSGAVNIPLDQIQLRMQEFKEMQPPVVAYCRSGNRSGLAVTLQKQNGVNEVTNGGGLNDMLQQMK